MQSFKVRFRIYDLLFYLLLVVSFYYTRNMLCRIMMVVFFGYTVAQMIIRKAKIPYTFYYIGFALFILYGALHIMRGNAIYPSVARTMVISLTLNFAMIFSIVQYVNMSDDVGRVLRITELGIFSTAFVVVILSVGSITEGRLGGGTEINSNMLAILCVYGFGLSMYLRKIGKLSQLSSWGRIAFYLLVILLTGSRKGLLMVLLTLMVVRFTQERRQLFKNLVIVGGSVAVFYILIMNVPVLYNIIGVRVEDLLATLAGEATEDASLEDRQRLVEIGLEYIKENPWIGYGYDCFKMISGIGANGYVRPGAVGFYSHNNYIELLFGGGIIGFSLYYLPVLYLLGKLLAGLRKDPCVPYLLAMLVSKLAMEYAYVSYYERVDAYIVAVILGCVLIAGNGKTKGNRTNAPERTFTGGDAGNGTDCEIDKKPGQNSILAGQERNRKADSR